jgi:hypothetical protein
MASNSLGKHFVVNAELGNNFVSNQLIMGNTLKKSLYNCNGLYIWLDLKFRLSVKAIPLQRKPIPTTCTPSVQQL